MLFRNQLSLEIIMSIGTKIQQICIRAFFLLMIAILQPAVFSDQPISHKQASILNGKSLLQRNQLIEGKELFMRLFKEYPCDEEVKYWLQSLAEKFVEENDLRAAEQLYLKVLECDPRNLEIRLKLAAMYIKEFDYSSAQNILAEALLDYPGNYRAQMMLGDLYLVQGRLLAAERLFEDFPCDPLAMDKLQEIAERLIAIGKSARGIDIYRQLFFCRPNDAGYGIELSKLLIADRNFQEALSILEKISLTTPYNAEIYAEMGNVYMQLNKPFEAEKMFLKALEYQPCLNAALLGLKTIANQLENFAKWRQRAFYLYRVIAGCDPVMVGLDLYRFSLYQEKDGAVKDIISQLKGPKEDVPQNVQRLNQLGYYYLLERMPDVANCYFRRAFCLGFRNNETLIGLQQTAELWMEEDNYRDAIIIYRMLSCAEPQNTNYLYFLGRALGWAGRRSEAIRVLTQAVKHKPYHFDIQVQLALTYYWEKDYHRARGILKKFAEIPYARENLGKVEYSAGNYRAAENDFRFALRYDPGNWESRLGLARSLNRQLRFQEAKKEYLALLKRYPDSELPQYELFRLRKHTNGTGRLNSSFILAKENDRDLNAPVVETTYLNNSYTMIFPLAKKISLSFEPFINYQKEKNLIQTQRLNYHVLLPGSKFELSTDINAYFSGDLALRIKNGRNLDENFFPFDNTTRFEPASSLTFTKDNQYARVEGYFASFIIKNFAQDVSQLQGIKIWDVNYSYQLDRLWLSPILGWQFRKIYYEDSLDNREWEREYWIRINAPIWPEYFWIKYKYDNDAFKKLSPNYNSFKHRRKNTIEVHYYREWDFKTFLEIVFERGWKTTEDEVTVIGAFDAFSTQRKVTSYGITGKISRRFFDRATASIEGGFYRDTFPYREGKIKGSIEWRF